MDKGSDYIVLVEQRKTEPNEAVYRAFVQLILARAFTCLELYEVREPKSTDLTTRLISYMTKNFRQPISLESLSKELGVSKYHLSHVFSERLHTGFNEYLNFLRLSEAIGLLSTTQDSITDICMSCGFSSQSTFNRAFLNRFSITPRQYRLLYSGIKICERD